MKFLPGTNVKILRCEDIPFLVGKIAKVEYFQDCSEKVKVSFDEKWHGYFKEYDLIEVKNENKNKKETDKTKIKFYSKHKTYHKQIIISGIRNDKSKYKVICDEKIKDLIIKLNQINCRTLWSCQGHDKSTPYVVISGSELTKKKLVDARKIVYDYWGKDHRILSRITTNGDIAWYAYPTH